MHCSSAIISRLKSAQEMNYFPCGLDIQQLLVYNLLYNFDRFSRHYSRSTLYACISLVTEIGVNFIITPRS